MLNVQRLPSCKIGLGFDMNKASTSGTKQMSFVRSVAVLAGDGSTIKADGFTVPEFVDLSTSQKVCLRIGLEPDEWNKGSGCSKYMTGNRSLFSTYKAYDEDYDHGNIGAFHSYEAKHRNNDCETGSQGDNMVGSPHGFLIHWIHKDGDGDASFQLESDSLPHAHAQTTKTYYKHQDSRIMKAQELKTKTSAQTLIYKIFLQRYQVYQGRLLASFQDDAKYEHVGQDTRSQGGKDDQDGRIKI
ncbi:hypothetical protein Tco_0152195 [Tanacetum coccineum]